MADTTPNMTGGQTFRSGVADSAPYSKAEQEALRYMGNPNHPQSKAFQETISGKPDVEWPRSGIFDVGTESQVAQRSMAQVRVLGEAAPVDVDLRALAGKVRDHMPQDPKEQEAYVKQLTEGRTFDFAKHDARKAALHAERDAAELEAGKATARESLRTQLTAPPQSRAGARQSGFDKIKKHQAEATTPDAKVCGGFSHFDAKPVDCAAAKPPVAEAQSQKAGGAKPIRIGAAAKMDLHGLH